MEYQTNKIMQRVTLFYYSERKNYYDIHALILICFALFYNYAIIFTDDDDYWTIRNVLTE